MGEAFKKLSMSEAWNLSHSDDVDSLNVVRFGKTKWFKDDDSGKHSTNRSRLTALLKRGSEGGVIVLGWSADRGSWARLISRVRRSGSGPEVTSEKL